MVTPIDKNMEGTQTHTGTMVDNSTMVKTDMRAPMKDTDEKMENKMKNDKMMMKDLKKMYVAELVVHYGYNWKKDRAMFADKAGIKKYTGTAKQNLMIKKYILDMAKTMGIK